MAKTVWLITPRFPPNVGGLAATALRYEKHLRHLGYSVVVVCIPPFGCRGPRTSGDGFARTDENRTVICDIHRFAESLSGLELDSLSYAEWQTEVPRLVAVMMESVAATFGPPEQLFHLYVSRNVHVVAQLARTYRARIVACPRGSDVNRDLWTDSRGGMPCSAIRAAKAVLCPNEHILDVAASFGTNARLILSPNSVHPHWPHAVTEPRDGPVLIPGPFNLKKGGLLALRMLERTLASHRLSHAVIVRFDGDHPAADAALRHLSRSFCERIELLPTLASDDFHALLTRTSVILTCSLSEGFSNTVLEAIAAGNLACAPTSAIPPAIREHFGHKVYLFDPLSQDDQDRTLRQALLASPTQTGGDFRDVLRRLWEAEEDALRSAVE